VAHPHGRRSARGDAAARHGAAAVARIDGVTGSAFRCARPAARGSRWSHRHHRGRLSARDYGAAPASTRACGRTSPGVPCAANARRTSWF
jgi:hypothetical protein